MSDSKIQGLYAERALQLQTRFQEQLIAAQNNGDLQEMQKCAAEFQVESSRLLEWLNGRGPDPGAFSKVTDEQMDIYSHEVCATNLNRVAFRGDRNQMHKFMNDPDFKSLVRDLHAMNPMGSAHKAELSRTMRLSPELAPHLFRVVSHVQDTLGLRVTPQIYVRSSFDLSAKAHPILNGRLPLLLTSGLIESFSEQELSFVLGREFAHSLFDHFRIPVDLLIASASESITPDRFLRLAGWERAREISADRLGLLCCKDFAVAASALFKLSSGLTSEAYRVDAQAYLARFSDLESLLADTTSLEEFYSTQAFNPIRLKALELFSRSVMFHELSGSGTNELSDREMETSIQRFCGLLEPTYLDETDATAQVMREFVFLSSLLISRTDGELTQERVTRLSAFLGKTAIESLSKLPSLDESEIASQLQARAVLLNSDISAFTKLNLIHDLGKLIASDGHVSEDEYRVLAMICEALTVDPMFSLSILPPPELPTALKAASPLINDDLAARQAEAA